MTIYEFFFQDFWHWLGATVWILILIGWLQRKIFPKVVTGWNKYTTMFKDNWNKEAKVKP